MGEALKTATQIQKSIKKTIKDGHQTSFSILGYKGLGLRVRPKKDGSATADFRHRYTHPYTGKRPYMTLGTYPYFTLEQARTAQRDNLSLLAQGIDPLTHRNSEKQAKAQSLINTFEAVANDWLSEQTSNPDEMPTQKTLYNWSTHLESLNNEFGKQPINTITSQQVINLCKRIQKTHIAKGNRVQGMANNIFVHAVLNGHTDTNPISHIKGAKVLKTKTTNSHPALVKPNEFACLLNDIEQISNPSQPFNKPILQLLALTFVRIGDICSMKWADIDLNTRQWVFKPQKSKGRGGMVNSLIVPLAPQTIKILEALQPLTGADDYVFHNHRRKAKPHHDKQSVNKSLNDPSMNKDGIGENYEGKGYQSVHSPHGFRSSAKTLLMEKLGYDHLTTELQSGHSMPDSYGNTYNRMEAIEKRTKMMMEWANYLDELKAGRMGKRIYHNFKVKEPSEHKIG